MSTESISSESLILSDGFTGKTDRIDSVRLQLKEDLQLPLEAEVLTPDVIGGLPRDQIRKLPVLLGNRQFQLSDFFEIEGERNRCLELHGNLANVNMIGRHMTRGSIVIHGDAGMHLGSSMSGGFITVHGNASDWLGAEMSGGVILIDGAAGAKVAMRMRRGLICIQGPVGDLAGLQMRGGTLFLCGTAGIRTGARMSSGRIIALAPIKLLPTFTYAYTHEPDFLCHLMRQLHDSGVADLGYGWHFLVKRYTGDTSGRGEGEILICAPASVQ